MEEEEEEQRTIRWPAGSFKRYLPLALDKDEAEILVVSLVLSRLDHGNHWLAGVPGCLTQTSQI